MDDARTDAVRQRLDMHLADEDGITLVEVMVAIVLLGIILSAMAQSLVTSMTAAQAQERQVHATSLSRQLVEEVRGLPWPQLGLCDDDVTATFPSGTYEYPDGTTETVVRLSMSDDICSPISEAPVRPTATVERNGVEYTVTTVITWHDDPVDGTAAAGTDDDPDDLKHLLVETSWDHRGDPASTVSEAYVAEDAFTPVLIPEVLHAGGVSYTYLHHYDGEDEGAAENDGLTQTDVVLRVTASVPQSGVNVRWLTADGTYISPVPMSSTDKLEWTYTIEEGSPDFDVNRLSNGETVFEFTGSDDATGELTVAFARGLFLIEPAGVGVSDVGLIGPAGGAPGTTLRVLPDGQLCGPYTLTTFADGLLRSDFVTAVWTDGLGQQEMRAAGGDDADPTGARFTSTLMGSVAADDTGALPATVTVSFYLQRIGDGLTVGQDPATSTPPWSPSVDLTVEEVASC